MTMTVDRSAFMEAALSLALRAGETIMTIYETDFDVEIKGDSSPVTQADVAAEKIILDGLRHSFPSLPIVAEEEAAAGRLPETGEQFVLVDPLDGTREFTSRNGAFTVNVALIENGVPVAGIVHAPALNRTFGGVLGRGAFEVKEGARKVIKVRASNPEMIVAVASRSHLDDDTKAFLEKCGAKEKVSIGSSLKFCLLAAGEADVYPRFGRTMEWDTAAGHAVLNAAGGSVSKPDGTPFIYGKRNQAHDIDFANGAFVARGG